MSKKKSESKLETDAAMDSAAENSVNIDKDQFRSNILALVSHELNTPLTCIMNALAVLEDRFPCEDEFVLMLRRNSERLQKAIHNMMELSYADAGTLRVRLSETNLEHVLLFQLEELKAEMQKQGFQPVVFIEQDVPSICADGKRLGRVLNTLISNAIKFSDVTKADKKAKKRIHISMSMQTEDSIPVSLRRPELSKQTALYLVVEIRSSLPSVGDRPESAESLFEAFTPWKDINTRERDGLGLELPLAKEILHAHAGVLWAHLPEAKDKPWSMRFALPILSREDELKQVLSNRLMAGAALHSKVSVVLMKPDATSMRFAENLRALEKRTRELLFRSSDSVFSVAEIGELAIVMDDCDETGAERVAKRLVSEVHKKLPGVAFTWARATGPDDSTTASGLLDAARLNWQKI